MDGQSHCIQTDHWAMAGFGRVKGAAIHPIMELVQLGVLAAAEVALALHQISALVCIHARKP